MKLAAVYAEERDSLPGLVKDKLRDLGVTVKPAKKSRTFVATPGRSALRKGGPKTPGGSQTGPKTVFGRPLRDLKPNTWIADGHPVSVPHFLTSILDFLKDHLSTEGIFRKAGSAARQKILRQEIEAAETFVPPDERTQGGAGSALAALDAASLLKQWLRELPEPLIPPSVEDSLLSAAKISGPSREQAILLCTLLLKPLPSSCLARLMRFLSEVAAGSAENKMDARSLAIVFTPSLFQDEPSHSTSSNTKQKLESTGHGFTPKFDIVELLIKKSEQVSMLDETLSAALEFSLSFTSHSEDNLDAADDGEAKPGPIARRRKKKKRRDGSLSRAISNTMKNLKNKVISRSATPAGTRSSSAHDLHLDPSVQDTPMNFNASDFASPFLPGTGKRKVANQHELSPTSKFSKAGAESMITPKVARGRSISIKNRFRGKKSTAGTAISYENSASVACVTPSTNKSGGARLNLAMTPGTPGSAFSGGVPQAGQDLSLHSLDKSANTLDGSYNAKSRMIQRSNTVKTARLSVESCDSVKSSTSKRSSVGSRVSRRNSGGPRVTAKKISPPLTNHTKIGVTRRRSREMAKQLSSKHLAAETDKNLEVKSNACGRAASLRRGQPNTFSVRPSPMRVEKTSGVGERTTRIKMSFKEGQIQNPKVVPSTPKSTYTSSASAKGDSDTGSKKKSLRKTSVNESLTNLRSDISSLIEQSFGPSTPASKSSATKKTSAIPAPEISIEAVETPMKSSKDLKVDDEVSFNFKSPSAAFELRKPVSPVKDFGTLSSVVTRSMRRQSSAFEVSSKRNLGYMPPAGNIRRQSSAFELAAKNKHRIAGTNDSRTDLYFKNSSVKDLVRRLESVDVSSSKFEGRTVHKRKSVSAPTLPLTPSKPMGPHPTLPKPFDNLENVAFGQTPSKAGIPFADEVDSNDFKDEIRDDFSDAAGFEEHWTDAKEFFDKTPINRRMFGNVDDAPGCKRSSILRIRKERKGLVSKNVETFTKSTPGPSDRPSTRQTIMGPPKMVPTPRRPIARRDEASSEAGLPTAAAPRRLSARMGVASKQPINTGKTVPQNPVIRRQTLTGIRTTTTKVPREVERRGSILREGPTSSSFKTPQRPVLSAPKTEGLGQTSRRSLSPRKPMRDCKHPSALSIKRQASQRTEKRPLVRIESPKLEKTPKTPSVSADKKTPGSSKKARRSEGRRYLTIGYEGEMRSPLKEKQNLIASVQRSKSAQTPSRLKYKENYGKTSRCSPYSRTPERKRAVHVQDENAMAFLATPTSATKVQSRIPDLAPNSNYKRQLGGRALTPRDLASVNQLGGLSIASPAIRKSPRLAKLTSGY